MSSIKSGKERKRLLYIINADWYFCLHWLDRAKYFAGNGYEVHVASPVTDQENVDKLTSLGFVFHSLDVSRSRVSPFSLLKEFFCVLNVIRGVKPALINSVTVKPNVMAGMCSLFFGLPIVCAVTGLGVNFSTKSFKGILSKFFIVKFYYIIGKLNHSSRFVFENNDDLDLIKYESSLADKQVVRVYGAGVDDELFKKSKLLNVEGEIHLFFASRLLKSKGLMYLLEAVEVLNDKGFCVTLDVAGIEDLESDDALLPEDLVRLKNTYNVNFLGKIDNVESVIPRYDLICLPTFYGEGIPRILIEAAASGRPILATNKGGMAEICVDDFNGFLVDSNSVISIVDAVKKYINNENLLSTHGNNGRLLFEQKFTNNAVFSVFSDMYDSVFKDI